METFGARVHRRARSTETNVRPRGARRSTPDSTGSLGIAISEAVEVAATHDDTKYALGSVLNHVLLHQTVIGQEAMLQLEMAGDYPDIVVGCTGGGSNFAGIAFPFIGAQLRGGTKVRVDRRRAGRMPEPDARAATPTTSATPAKLTPLAKMHTLGSRPSCRPDSTPAGCAITAWRRWSRTSRSWA